MRYINSFRMINKTLFPKNLPLRTVMTQTNFQGILKFLDVANIQIDKKNNLFLKRFSEWHRKHLRFWQWPLMDESLLLQTPMSWRRWTYVRKLASPCLTTSQSIGTSLSKKLSSSRYWRENSCKRLGCSLPQSLPRIKILTLDIFVGSGWTTFYF